MVGNGIHDLLSVVDTNNASKGAAPTREVMWPRPSVSSTWTRSPGPNLRRAPSLVVTSITPRSITTHWRAGAGCGSLSNCALRKYVTVAAVDIPATAIGGTPVAGDRP